MTRRTIVGMALALSLLAGLLSGAGIRSARAFTGRAAGDESLRQDAALTKTFVWEEYGLTFTLPEDWQVLGQSQNYDLALVSPGVLESGEGAFIMLQVYPSLGPDTTMDGALGPVAEQVGGEVAPFSAAGLDGFGVSFNDEASATSNHLALLPYGEKGAALFIQASAGPEEDATVLGILDSMLVDPPAPDYAAIDAAWQSSLAEEGRLIYGADDAPVSAIEFFSFTCGHCANYSMPIEHLIALEADTGRMRIEVAPIAGDEMAMRATEATLCAAEQGKGYSAYKALWDGYLTVGYEEAYSEEGVRTRLEPLGVDLTALDACMDTDTYGKALDAIRTDFLDYGLSGTPTVLLGADGGAPETLKFPDGRVWSGIVPIDTLRALIRLVIDEGLSVSEAMSTYLGG